MNSAYYVSILILVYTNSFAQIGVGDIYLQAFEAHLSYRSNIEEKVFNRKLNSVFVERNEQSEKLPNSIAQVKIILLSKDDILRISRKGDFLDIIDIRPGKIADSTIVVNIIDFRVKTKGRNFNYLNGGGSVLHFQFDCKIGRLMLTKKVQGGI